MNNENDSLYEFDRYKREFKDSIQELINKGLIQEAKYMIDEYERIVNKDIEIFSMRGVAYILEGNFDKAETVLKEGLEIQSFNFDLLYNLAYMYEIVEKYISAYRYYVKALNVANDEMIIEINKKLEELKCINKVREYTLRKKVLIIAYIFPPVGGSGVQRSLKFVKYLREFGFEPVVITVGNTRYPLKDETLIDEIPEEVEIIRIKERTTSIDSNYINKLIHLYSGIVNDSNLINKYINVLNSTKQNVINYLLIPDYNILWATEVLNVINEKLNFSEIDIIYTTSGPYSDHIIGYYLKRWYDIPWIADFRDEWTNNPYAKSDKENICYQISFLMENNIVHYADKVNAVTPVSKLNYEKIFGLNPSKVLGITNGYDEEDFSMYSCKDVKNEKFTIMHNGLLYMIRTPLTFMKAIQNILKKNKIKRDNIKVIFGFTENLNEWLKIRDDLGLNDIIEFLDYMPHRESLALAGKSDVLLLIVGHGEKNKSVYPGKLFEYLRLSKPILALSPEGSIVDMLLSNLNRGINVEFEDIDKIENSILDLYSNWEKGNTLNYTISEDIEKFSRKNLTKELCNAFLSTISESKINSEPQILLEKNSDFYDELFESGGWNEMYYKHYSESHYFRIWLEALKKLKRITSPKIIEIGCGPGQFANLLFDNGLSDYQGIDFSSEAIKYAKIRNSEYKGLFNIDDAYTSNIFNKDYNVAIIFEVLEHVNDDLNILEKVRRDTYIMFSVPNFYSDGHVRWFNSKLDIFNRYRKYVEYEEIQEHSVGGLNKIYLISGKKR